MGKSAHAMALCAMLAACGGEVREPPQQVPAVPGADNDQTATTGQTGQAGAAAEDPLASLGSDTPAAPSGSSDATNEGGAGSTPMLPPDGPQQLPTPTARCPELVDGVVSFSPPALAVYQQGASWRPPPPDEPRPEHLHSREVTLWLDPDAAREMDGPLVFYWYGTGSSPREAIWGGLTQPVIDEIKASGGIIALPTHDGENTYPWYPANGRSETYDLIVADEILACAIEQLGIDTRRIYSLGLSAGGMQTTWMGYLRSNYMAGIVSYSGGLSRDLEHADPDNKFVGMATHGGPTDTGGQLNFMEESITQHEDLKSKGHFSILCDNSPAGHTIPRGIGPAAWRFLQAHPYGSAVSPWAEGLPADFPDICTKD